MKTKPVFWPIKFLISTRTPDGEEVVKWVLDQRIRDKYNERAWDRLYSEVQEHLHQLSERTGFEYLIETWGYAGSVQDYIEMYRVEVH